MAASGAGRAEHNLLDEANAVTNVSGDTVPLIPKSVSFVVLLSPTTTRTSKPFRYRSVHRIIDSGGRTDEPRLKAGWFQDVFVPCVLEPILSQEDTSVFPAGMDADTFHYDESKTFFLLSLDGGEQNLRLGSLLEHLIRPTRAHGEQAITVYVFIGGLSTLTVDLTRDLPAMSMIADAGVAPVPPPSVTASSTQHAPRLHRDTTESSTAESSRPPLTDPSAPIAASAAAEATSCACPVEPLCYIKGIKPGNSKPNSELKTDHSEIGPFEKLYFLKSDHKTELNLNGEVFTDEGYREFMAHKGMRSTKKGYAEFYKSKLMALLFHGQVWAETRFGFIRQILPTRVQYRLTHNPEFKAPMYSLRYRYDTDLKEKFSAATDFQITVKHCTVCNRLNSIIWNRNFAPLRCSEDFDLQSLRELFEKLCCGVKRDPTSGEELFAELPCMDGGLPISLEQARLIFREAGAKFAEDEAHTTVTAPANVGGDIHGEITALWFVHLFLNQNREIPLVLLGDFVEKGENSVLVLFYVAVFKILNPKGIYLIRGNHETREQNDCIDVEGETTLLSECLKRFGDLGSEWCDMFNEFFDCLPFAISLKASDETQDVKPLTLLHGGPSMKYVRLDTWNDISRDLREPELFDVMWSDPHDDESFAGLYDHSSPRGERSKLFGRAGLEQFLNANSSQGLIRGHGAPADGYESRWDGLVRTIGSNLSDCRRGACLRVGRDLDVSVRKFDKSELTVST